MLSLGYSPGKADGYVGQKTINSIKEFQKENELPVDLNINEQLLSKINSSQPRVVPQRHEDLPSTNNVKIDQNQGVCPTGKICVHP